MTMMTTKRSPAQRRADARYEAERRDRGNAVKVTVRLEPHDRALLTRLAEQHGSQAAAIIAGLRRLESDER